MPNASTYRVTFPYGATTAPYSAARPHKGEDRAMPIGTPVDVGNTIIGLSGNTGKSTGPHLHIQKVANGVVAPPQGAGLAATIAFPARVFDLGNNNDIGNFIRLVDAKGVQWSYFHLSKINVTLNQEVNMQDKITKEQEDVCALMSTGSLPGKDYNYQFVGKPSTQTNIDALLNFWYAQRVDGSNPVEKEKARKYDITREALGIV